MGQGVNPPYSHPDTVAGMQRQAAHLVLRATDLDQHRTTPERNRRRDRPHSRYGWEAQPQPFNSVLANWYRNAETLKIATSVNAELLALSNLRIPYSGKLGVIEKGAFADLLVVDGNPLDDIHLIENPGKNLSIVMKDGVIYKNTL